MRAAGAKFFEVFASKSSILLRKSMKKVPKSPKFSRRLRRRTRQNKGGINLMVPKLEVQIRRILSSFEKIFLPLDIKNEAPMESAPQARKFLRF